MEELKYIIEDQTIAEILGVQNFSNKESAMLELVKNAYDSGATNVEICFETDRIIISDNGCGMSSQDIKDNWMHIGHSTKGYTFKDIHNDERIYAGSKGIGRFALSRLGEVIDLYAKMEGQEGIFWHTDWTKNILDKSKNTPVHGTRIIISKLRDKWTTKSISNLNSFLSRTYNSSLMQIDIRYQGKNEKVDKYFQDVKLGHNCLAYFELFYDSQNKQLNVTIHSDEFEESAKKYCADINLNYKTKDVDISKEFSDLDELDIEDGELDSILENIGDFSATMFFSLKSVSTVDKEKFLYKYQVIPNRFEAGVILYRNAFSISSYEGKKDWLEFGKRSRISPAAASHPTGSWRVRENQIAGYVNIDKIKNKYLTDLSNRQGLEENIYYKLFIKILQCGVEQFENYRQSIIRKINVKNDITDTSESPMIDRIVESAKSIHDLNDNELDLLAREVQQLKKDQDVDIQTTIETEERYKYDVRILNVLSTVGLRAASIAHEIRNDRNAIEDNCQKVINALKLMNLWDEVNKPENTQFAFRNIPELLQRNGKVNKKIVRFMDTMLTDIEKSQFVAKKLDIINILKNIKQVWERDYTWISISVPRDSIMFNCAEDVVKVLFDNLILNSIQQNDSRNNLHIFITIKEDDDALIINYRDDGVGLPTKYLSNPKKILEVHETSRKNGHGLGMWIVNNTLVMSGGSVIDIPVKSGFEIVMKLGDKL